MAVKKRRTKVAGKGAGKPAPSASNGGGIKRRTSIPVEPDIPEFPGELGSVVRQVSESGEYGKPFIKGSSRRLDIGRIRTGILAIDLCLGGGWVMSRGNMLVGEKSSGKSTIASMSIASAQRAYPDDHCAVIDAEGTFDKAWARKLGVDLDRLVIVEPETGEHAVDLTDAMLRAREIRLVVVDSIAMMVPMKEVEESTQQEFMGLQARLIGKYVRKATNALLRERGRGHVPTLLSINQFRMKIGLVFGDPRTMPGGKALEFLNTQQVETKNKEIMGKDGDSNNLVVFNEHNIKITKNKGGGPMKEAMFKLIRLDGYEDLPEGFVNQAKTIYKFGTQAGLITGAPSSFEVEGIRTKFRGAPAFNKWALDNPLDYGLLQERILAVFRKRWDLA